jgi:glycosyltransferase involved in cell wall biosynthesis
VPDAIPVSVLVPTKNEEQNIVACLDSLGQFDEVFVVDSPGWDRTAELATNCGATVIEFDWNGEYPRKKQWALENVPLSHRWVLLVDADERVTPELAEEIRRTVANPRQSGYFAGLDYVFLGRLLRHGQRVHKLVLFDHTASSFPEHSDLDVVEAGDNEVHVHVQFPGKPGLLKGRLLHDDHDSLYHYFDRHNRYSEWEAKLRRIGELPLKDERQPGLRGFQKRVFNALPLRGVLAFLVFYIGRFGFLDGRAGFHYAVAKAFYYWQIRVKELELAQVEPRRRTTTSLRADATSEAEHF